MLLQYHVKIIDLPALGLWEDFATPTAPTILHKAVIELKRVPWKVYKDTQSMEESLY